MSFNNFRFNDVDQKSVTEEVKNLYRVRDNDKHKYKSLGITFAPVYPTMDSGPLLDMHRLFSNNYCDKKWLEMSETERIENGLPTKLLTTLTKPFFIFMGLAALSKIFFNLAISAGQYDKLFHPQGVILRNQRKLGLTSRLKYENKK